ncbi:MAG TPA: GTP cyclohydrolase [Gammaproteobacteria bacterium]|nr:GTP cyclohydrolase [Gammaproteobacteria bacterium]HAU23874.1 GTP cyclohydrolase [Gammaproteobacteria bacterium]HCI88089.1 GTP cyclohydrolase [Gammaproteobacteria bacterium]|tara:strand:- start:4696 stop:5415 length:720 start_codon:yes stop_codon:yes gene_type:complete
MSLNRQIEVWLHSRIESFRQADRPFITLTYAQSWDGSVTNRCGETLNFSGPESTQITHQLRSLHDGILVGIGTILSDDPQLTVREWDGPNPQPVVLDSQLRTPPTARICHHPDKACWILTSSGESDILSEHASVIPVGDSDSERQEVPLTAAMKLLKERGLNSLMVEGGATVITAFLKAGLVDGLVLTVAPRLLGGYKAIDELLASDSGEPLLIKPIHTGQAGSDLVVWGDLQYGDSAA